MATDVVKQIPDRFLAAIAPESLTPASRPIRLDLRLTALGLRNGGNCRMFSEGRKMSCKALVRSEVFRSLAIVAVLVVSSFAVISPAAAESNYIAINMGSGLEMTGVGDGQQVGGLYTQGVSGNQAALLMGTSHSLVRLTPSLYPYSLARDTAAGQQVGEVQLSPSSPRRAALWQGTADSFVDLHPTGASKSWAFATDGSQQVGDIDGRAALWTGTSASVVKLSHPSGFSGSTARAVLNGVQAGWGHVSGGGQHALLWTGTASSVVDLHPAGYSESAVYGLGDGLQVGYGVRLSDGAYRLLLWRGTAESVSDVTPNGAPTFFSVYDGAGAFIVGQAYPQDGPSHAHVWSIYGEMTDLHTTFPSPYSTYGSDARGVDALGNAVGGIHSGANDAVFWWRTGLIDSPTFTVGTDTFLQSVTVDAAKSMNISSLLTVAEGCSLVLDGANITAVTTKFKIGSTLSGQGTIQGAISGDPGSRIVATGDLSLGNADAFNSFQTAGELEVGSATVTLNSKGFTTLGGLTTLEGGTLTSATGVSLGVGRNLSGWGSVGAKVAAGFGSTIEATGNLALGNASSAVGFTSDGELYSGANTVVINDANEAVLGSLTQLGQGTAGGTLTAGNANPSDSDAHFLLEEGKNVIGRGTVNGHFENHGHVVGDGTDGSERIVFSEPWTISGDGTFENTLILGTFAPGNSPGVVNGTNQGFGGIVEIELGGIGQYDQINDSASILLSDSTTLSILPLGGFVPTLGQQFEIMTWQEGLSAPFGTVQVDPFFVIQGISFELDYYNAGGAGGLTLMAIPEPSTLVLLGTGALALAVWGWRHRRKA